MYTVNNITEEKGILNYLPSGVRKYMDKINLDEAYEIHLRLGKPLSIYYSDGCYFVHPEGILTKTPKGAVKITKSHIEEALEIASKSSLYARKHNISEGFLTIEGGHRIGLCGTGVIKDGTVDFLKDISSLNYRLSFEAIGFGDRLNVIKNNVVQNTLIISPPGAGKTTMLRDIARTLSEKQFKVGIVDERSEIAAVSSGMSPFRLGYFTDVLDGIKKSDGMVMMLRSMAPDVIITDEIGKPEDITAMESVINSGVKIITSLHGFNLDQIMKRDELGKCVKFFDLFCVLSKAQGVGTIEQIIKRSDIPCLN